MLWIKISFNRVIQQTSLFIYIFHFTLKKVLLSATDMLIYGTIQCTIKFSKGFRNFVNTFLQNSNHFLSI